VGVKTRRRARITEFPGLDPEFAWLSPGQMLFLQVSASGSRGVFWDLSLEKNAKALLIQTPGIENIWQSDAPADSRPYDFLSSFVPAD
jgi:hypothetical protein